MNSSYLRWLRTAVTGVIVLILVASFTLACTFVYIAPALPTAKNMHSVELAVPLRVYTRSAGLISQIGEQRRIPVSFDQIPLLVRQAVLAAEDDRFFEHHGFDWMGITRALIMNVATLDDGQGGSTITQQAARNMFLTLDKTLRRKLSEVFVTYRMESDFTKEQILATYLNVIYFGQRSYGIAAAAETFYGKKLDELTVAQAATLAGIIQLPSRYNPVTNPKLAEARRSYVLRRMTQVGYIDQATAAAASREPVASRGFAPLYDVEAPYVAELARQKVVELYGEDAVNAGYKVFTTLDDRLQTAANRALRLGLMEYDRRHGYRGPLAKVKLPAAPSASDLEQLMSQFSAISLLQPAVVLSVADTGAEIHIRGLGKARIAWEGLSWARAAVKNGVGPAPRKAADVLTAGDVIYVVTDKRGSAQLAQQPLAQSALVALDPEDGAIVSMVGGFDFYSNNFNRVTQAHRQPGSGFKPFLYSAALENGLTPASTFMDMPVLVERGDNEENWKPENSNGKFTGLMRLREALVLSKNTISIRILQQIGTEAAINHAVKFGFRKDSLPPYLSLALGTQTVTPLEMATGFATFANGGFKIDPYFISRIEDSSGKVLFEANPKIACIECEQNAAATVPAPMAIDPAASAEHPLVDADNAVAAAVPLAESVSRPAFHDVETVPALRELARVQGGLGYLPADRLAPRVLSYQNAWLMDDIMHDVAERGTAKRTRALGRDDLAGKTGTSQQGRDNWFNGFNQQIVASVWVGLDEDTSLGRGEEGGTTAVPIWMHFMREALRGVPSNRLPRPGGLIDLKISRFTGTLADPLDSDAIYETFMLNHQPGLPESGAGPGGTPRPGSNNSGEPLF